MLISRTKKGDKYTTQLNTAPVLNNKSHKHLSIGFFPESVISSAFDEKLPNNKESHNKTRHKACKEQR